MANVFYKAKFTPYRSGVERDIKLAIFDLETYERVLAEIVEINKDPINLLSNYVDERFITKHKLSIFCGGRHIDSDITMTLTRALLISHGIDDSDNLLSNDLNGKIVMGNGNIGYSDDIGFSTSYGSIIFSNDDFSECYRLNWQYSWQGTSQKNSTDVLDGGVWWNNSSFHSPEALTTTEKNSLKSLINGNTPSELDDDPNSNDGNADTGGGTGDFDGSSDNINFPNLPSTQVTSTGFITLYRPTLSQLNTLATFMWKPDFFDAIVKLFADPMDAILGLNIVPINVSSSGSQDVKVGNVSTGVTMDIASSQYATVDCGTINVNEYWGSALDYSPYTKAQIYLPFCGIHSISVDEIMGKSVHVKYNIDLLSGSCVALVKCGGSVLYQFMGQCVQTIPVSGQNFAQVVSSALNIAGSVGMMVASGGMAAPISSAMAISGASSIASNVISAKPTIEHSGSLSGSGGQLAIKKPFIILERPRQSLAKNFMKFNGYPSNITAELGNLEGFTSVDQVHLRNMTCTDKEVDEIKRLLEEGVIL